MSIELASVCIIQKVLCLVYRSRASSNCLLLNKQTTMGGLDGTSSSSWINLQNEPNWPQTPSRYIVFIKYFELLFLKEKKMRGEKNRIGSTPCYGGKGCMQVCSSVELYDQIYKRFCSIKQKIWIPLVSACRTY